MAGERPAFSLHGPCFTRHLLFRLRKEENPRYIEGDEVIDDRQIRDKWQQITLSVTNLIKELRKVSSINLGESLYSNNDDSNNFSSIKSTIMREIRSPSYDGDKNGKFRIRMRIDVYSESIGITVASDKFSDGDLYKLLNSPDKFDDLDNIYNIWDTNHAIYGHFNEIIKRIGFPYQNLIGDFRGIMIPGISDHDYDLFEIAQKTSFSDKSRNIAKTVKNFASNKLGTSVNSEESSDFKSEKTLISSDSYLALAKLKESGQNLSNNIVNFCKKNGAIIDDFLRIREDYDKPSADSVMCSFLNGNVLYSAPLASNRLEPGDSECGIVKFLIVYGDVKGDQLGRLVRRLHILGELRYLALLDYKLENGEKDLKTVSNDLRHIGNKLDNYVKLNKENPILPMNAIKEINLSLSKISLVSDGSLIYRIAQSRYYANTFKDQIKDLRIGRIEGYQSYDQFIRRNVYQLFSKIDQIGQRYDLLGRRIERWILMSEADTSRKLLDNAENFATIFLVYYGGVIISKSWDKISDKFDAIRGVNFDYIWTVILLAVIADVVGNKKEITMIVYCAFRRVLHFVFFPYRVIKRILSEGLDMVIEQKNKFVHMLRKKIRED